MQPQGDFAASSVQQPEFWPDPVTPVGRSLEASSSPDRQASPLQGLLLMESPVRPASALGILHR